MAAVLTVASSANIQIVPGAAPGCAPALGTNDGGLKSVARGLGSQIQARSWPVRSGDGGGESSLRGRRTDGERARQI